MKRLAVAVSFALAACAGSACAESLQKLPVSLQDVIATVEKSFTVNPATGLPLVTTLTADFFQHSVRASDRKEQRADGEMIIRFADTNSPLMFRFDYFRPTTQQIVSNGKTLWIYLPENRQVIQSDVSFAFGSTFDADRRALNFLQGLGRISRDFLIVFAPSQQDPAGNFLLELTPRRSSQLITKLYMAVNRDAVMQYVASGRKRLHDETRPETAFPVLATTVIDPRGNKTTMEFSNIKTNMWLSDGIFNFIMPPGVQVVPPPARR